MRDIKFRVWANCDEGMKMVYLDNCAFDNGLWFTSDEHIDEYAESVMQYTGFKLGEKEIYEGDILREETDDEIYYAVVTWIKEWCMFACLVINGDTNEYETYLTLGAEGLDESMFWTFPLQEEEYGQRYLAGNIYGNPDLIS